MVKPIFISLALIFSISLNAQNSNTINKQALKELLLEIKQDQVDAEKRVNEYMLSKHLDNVQSVVDGNECRIIDVVDGVPKYYITHNQGAVSSVGVDQMRAGGSLDIDITGINSNIAVWDSNLPRETHQEFGDRITNRNSMTAISDHSTHVTGTIIAGGANPNAQGFCYNAEISAYDWINDTEEMILEAMSNSSHLVSNHSYGVPGGWVGDVWRGDISISDQEDYRFGYYDNEAATFDGIAYNAPYYTIVTSAGNDRNNIGDGSFPPDGPFDCISGFGTSKNLITVGAVNKLGALYSNPSDIVMSSFSSWGPLDDGRIKPDIVAPGVAILSSVSQDDSAYALQNGTSMASPCVTGTVALMNELYFSLNNRYLTSASLKALLIHTAYESGSTLGPDYSFGYGMINAEKAASLIIDEDGTNNIILESSLESGEFIEIDLSPIPDKKMTITIAWTDPAGIPVARSLDPTDLMLVNDLDIQLIDEQGEITLPWILNPANPNGPATRGDNFRDNIEKIELSNPKQLLYTLRIDHKGVLQSGKQNFSLIIDYESEQESAERIFWVGGDGSWSDASHWSLTSGGTSANKIPSINSKVIFDINSFPSGDGVAMMDQDFSITSLLGLSDSNISIDLGNNELKTSGPFIYGADNFSITDGNVIFENEIADKVSVINVENTEMNNMTFSFSESNNGTWNLSSQDLSLEELALSGGDLNISDCNITAKHISFNGANTTFIDLDNSTFIFSESLAISADISMTETGSNEFRASTDSSPIISIDRDVESDLRLEKCRATIGSAGGTINELIVLESDLELNSDINISELEISGPSSLILDPNTTMSLSSLVVNSSQAMEVSFLSTNSTERATVFIDGRSKLCYDYLIINNVDLSGQNSVSIGESSTLTNSDNWILGNCNQLLFADFTQDYLCEDGLSYFIDISDGDVIDREWYVDGDLVFGTEVLYYTFNNTGNHDIALVITDVNGNQSEYTATVDIQSTNLQPNTVIQNATQLASQQLASGYQWFNYGLPIPGATDRVYLYNGNPGIYWVLTFDGVCNRLSSTIDLGTATADVDLSRLDISPNPFSQELIIDSKDNRLWDAVKIYYINGQLVANYEDVSHLKINTSDWESGLYIISINNGSELLTRKLYKYE